MRKTSKHRENEHKAKNWPRKRVKNNVIVHFVQKSLVSSCRRITKSSVRDVNLETIIGTWYKTWQLWIQSYPCTTKSSHETEKTHIKIPWSRLEHRKLCVRTTRWNLGKHVRFLSWNQSTSTPHRSETNVIAERAVRCVKQRHFSSIATIRIG